jgi:hypothetical protein
MLQIDPGTGNHRMRFFYPTRPNVCAIQNKVSRSNSSPPSPPLRCLDLAEFLPIFGVADCEEGKACEGGGAHLQWR